MYTSLDQSVLTERENLHTFNMYFTLTNKTQNQKKNYNTSVIFNTNVCEVYLCFS